MGASPTLERFVSIEERLDALEMAFMAVMAADESQAEDEQRDSAGSMAGDSLGPIDYAATQAEKKGDPNPRLRRVIERAYWLLAGNPHAEITQR